MAKDPVPNPVSCTWSGVFPAATTQFDSALELRLPLCGERRAAVTAMVTHARAARPR